MVSLHCHNAVGKKRSIAQNVFLTVRTAMSQEDIDFVAGDFTCASWRRNVGADQQYGSTPEDAFKRRQTPGTTKPFSNLRTARKTCSFASAAVFFVLHVI